MGGGGSNYWRASANDDILKKIQDAENQSQKVSYDSWLADFLISSLGEFNNRDNDEIKRRIATITTVLGKDIDGVISTQFGGSIAKRTHVDGLSDVDTLVILNDTSLADKSPSEVLDYFHNKLSGKFPGKVAKGDMAITVMIDDLSIQLLPALKYKSGIKISDGGEWSSIVNPSVFARQLTVINKKLNGKLVPGIKLIKAIVANMPNAARLKGYHIESLAVEIFSKNEHKTVNNVKDVVVGFFKESSTLVKNPIKDTTGQTFYVDEYLGNKQSVKRMIASDALERISRRIEIAESGCQKDIWETLVNGS